MDNPRQWIEWVIDESIKNGLGRLQDMRLTFILPEALILAACDRLAAYPSNDREALYIGCQGVFREDAAFGGNFGAFTTNLPAAAAVNLGCSWAMVGHSEERRDKIDIIERFNRNSHSAPQDRKEITYTVNEIMNDELLCALRQGMNVLLCVGETAEEKGQGTFEEQKPRIREVLAAQLETGLRGVESGLLGQQIAIGYEPVWAIGPGKTPPGGEYIGFISGFIKRFVKERFDFDPTIVYGGGLKEENAGMISKVPAIDGGLVALTKFTGDIAFQPEGLRKIIDKYLDK